MGLAGTTNPGKGWFIPHDPAAVLPTHSAFGLTVGCSRNRGRTSALPRAVARFPVAVIPTSSQKESSGAAISGAPSEAFRRKPDAAGNEPRFFGKSRRQPGNPTREAVGGASGGAGAPRTGTPGKTPRTGNCAVGRAGSIQFRRNAGRNQNRSEKTSRNRGRCETGRSTGGSRGSHQTVSDR